jgi:hypothetical protein
MDLVDFWNSSDFEFSQKSMPRMGPATAACKKLDVENLSWNCSFLMNPQEGIV